jgi:hypothetical protein
MKRIFETEFSGMTLEPIDYSELVEIREKILQTIHMGLSADEKRFLISLKEGEPEWDLLGFSGLERLPALKWKLENIRKMSPVARRKQVVLLRETLNL